MERTEIEHLAELSKLEFSEKELLDLEKDFESLMNLADVIKNADIGGEKKLNIIDYNELREDKSRESTPVPVLLKNAPATKKDGIVVPRIVE